MNAWLKQEHATTLSEMRNQTLLPELRLFAWHKAAAILMTFDEDDFQKLVLNENGDIHEPCTEERKLTMLCI